MVAYESNGLSPRRQAIQGLNQRHSDHRADRITGATYLTGLLKVADQRRDFKGAEESRETLNVALADGYYCFGHWRRYLLGHDLASCCLPGSPISY